MHIFNSIKDEYYTPKIAVEPLLKYIPKNYKIWCPFDTNTSEYVLTFQENGYDVKYSHIWEGQDFYEYEEEDYDIIVSNPAFTRKLDTIKRLYELNKPFAILMSALIFSNHMNINRFFIDKDVQFLFFDRRIEFLADNHISFASFYICRNILPQDIIFEKIENNYGKHFIQSRMIDEQNI